MFKDKNDYLVFSLRHSALEMGTKLLPGLETETHVSVGQTECEQ